MDSPMLRATSLVGVASSTFLSAIYFGSTTIALPLLYGLPVDASTKGFSKLYYSGLKVVAPLATVAAISYGTSAYLDRRNRVEYATAAVASFASIPWTIIVMSGLINRVLALSKDAKLQEKVQVSDVEALLNTWGWQNMVRSAMAGIGGSIGLLVTTGSI